VIEENLKPNITQTTVPYEWNSNPKAWVAESDQWEKVDYIKYVVESRNVLYSAGEYLVLANSLAYKNVSVVTGVQETISDSGVGTILKKEFRYSIDSTTFSEFQELTSENLRALGSFKCVWFQFRYILLSGGPVTITKVEILYTPITEDPFNGYVAPNIQDESRIYAFPVTYKSNFLWEPYKMNRAVRLYKDLNLMVNGLFGHETSYYRALPQGRSKDVFLMEYSLYEHDEGRCVKVVVPNNQFPDNKLNMGPFGVDFELPFEVQVDKDYFQKIFGEGSGPQKRDILYFPRTNRIYEIASSYLFRDFMNEPLYFKISLIKWLPKSNAEQSESLNALEDYTVSAGKLFGEEIHQEEIKITNPEQFNVAYRRDDPVRYSVYAEQEIGNENVLNYYTQIAEHYYKMESALMLKTIKANVNIEFLTKNVKYFARYEPSSTQSDVQYYYSMKKFTYLGQDDDNLAIFSYEGGKSQAESLFTPSQIFFVGSTFNLYEKEYDGTLGVDPVASCDTNPAEYHKQKIVQYKAIGTFTCDEDKSFSAWFRLKDNPSGKVKAENFDFDIYTNEITVNLVKPFTFFPGDTASLTRISGTAFSIFGEISTVISQTSIKVKVDKEIYDYVKANYSAWTSFTDIQVQRNFPRVFLSSLKDGKGLKIELYENRFFKVSMNTGYNYFILPSSSSPVESGKWHAIFINFSNMFKQMTVNVWKMQWDPATKIPATTDLKLIYNKTVPLVLEDRSSTAQYFLEPSYMDLTNIRLFNKVAETDKQVMILNQNVVKDAQLAIIIDNALPQSKLPYIGYNR
jgi:hypothetical protein